MQEKIQARVDVSCGAGELKHRWNYIGYDECNYTHSPGGTALIRKIGALGRPFFIRTHHLLCTGIRHGFYKWGSTNVYTEDPDGRPVFDFETVDRIVDTWLENNCIPFFELGFMPKDLADPREAENGVSYSASYGTGTFWISDDGTANGISDDKKSISLEKVEFLEAAEDEGDATGCILHNETTGSDKSVNVIDNGFHLFVPDMHDKGTSNIDGNVLLAHLTSDKVTNDEGITRYVLTNKWYSTGDDEKQNVNTDQMKVRFVKVDHSTGARLSANSAYMELSKDAGAKIANIVLFYDEKEEPSGETTGIVTLESDNNENAVWYTLSGMRIEAPAKAGMYIRNGKKVVVRMK